MTGPLPSSYDTTREGLHQVAVHVVARARAQATGRFGLRVTAGGFGTPEFGTGPQRVRVSGSSLLAESGAAGGATTRAAILDGSSLREAARIAEVDLAAGLSVGDDTPPLGDVDRRLSIDRTAAAVVTGWFTLVAESLDAVVAELDASAAPTMVQLWPEHFDVALDVAFDPAAAGERRVNLGGSPGDGWRAEPYLYVGPWTADRPGDPAFWNAPFGAVLGYEAVASSDDARATTVAFFRRGLALLSG
jgi:hypothetical protein